MAAAHQAAAENPKAAEKIRGMLLDYKTNSLWQPGLMSEQELKNAGGDNPSARFSNLAGVAGGVTAAGGSALEVTGHAGSGKALGILGRGVGMPMAIASGIDQAQREGLKGEISCLVPEFNGAFLSTEWKEALWARFYTAAPRRQRQSVEQYKIVKRA